MSALARPRARTVRTDSTVRSSAAPPGSSTLDGEKLQPAAYRTPANWHRLHAEHGATSSDQRRADGPTLNGGGSRGSP